MDDSLVNATPRNLIRKASKKIAISKTPYPKLVKSKVSSSKDTALPHGRKQSTTCDETPRTLLERVFEEKIGRRSSVFVRHEERNMLPTISHKTHKQSVQNHETLGESSRDVTLANESLPEASESSDCQSVGNKKKLVPFVFRDVAQRKSVGQKLEMLNLVQTSGTTIVPVDEFLCSTEKVANIPNQKKIFKNTSFTKSQTAVSTFEASVERNSRRQYSLPNTFVSSKNVLPLKEISPKPAADFITVESNYSGKNFISANSAAKSQKSNSVSLNNVQKKKLAGMSLKLLPNTSSISSPFDGPLLESNLQHLKTKIFEQLDPATSFLSKETNKSKGRQSFSVSSEQQPIDDIEQNNISKNNTSVKTLSESFQRDKNIKSFPSNFIDSDVEAQIRTDQKRVSKSKKRPSDISHNISTLRTQALGTSKNSNYSQSEKRKIGVLVASDDDAHNNDDDYDNDDDDDLISEANNLPAEPVIECGMQNVQKHTTQADTILVTPQKNTAENTQKHSSKLSHHKQYRLSSAKDTSINFAASKKHLDPNAIVDSNLGSGRKKRKSPNPIVLTSNDTNFIDSPRNFQSSPVQEMDANCIATHLNQMAFEVSSIRAIEETPVKGKKTPVKRAAETPSSARAFNVQSQKRHRKHTVNFPFEKLNPEKSASEILPPPENSLPRIEGAEKPPTVFSHNAKKTNQRKQKKEKPSIPRMPDSQTRSIFQQFANMTVTSSAMPIINASCDMFWKSAIETLEAYAVHGGRQSIDKSDVELLLFRLGLARSRNALNALIAKYLPMELRSEIIPVAKAGNVVIP